MRNPAIILAFVLCLLGQSVTAMGHGLALNFGQDLSHQAMHEAGISHHHSHDGTSSRDESDESKQHVQHDHCPNTPAIPPADCATPLTITEVRAAPGLSAVAYPSPFIEGPRRPPRLHA